MTGSGGGSGGGSGRGGGCRPPRQARRLAIASSGRHAGTVVVEGLVVASRRLACPFALGAPLRTGWDEREGEHQHAALQLNAGGQGCTEREWS